MTESPINFSEWVAIDQQAARRLARDSDLKPLWLRIMFASIGWANLIGHTNFAHGGLGLVLQTNNPRTGELNIPKANQIGNEIKVAREKGLIGPASDATCLVAPDWWMKKGGTGGKSCQHHGIRAPRRASKKAEPFTQSVNEDPANFTQSVKLLHPKGEPLSANRPISDSGLFDPPADGPQPGHPDPTERHAS